MRRELGLLLFAGSFVFGHVLPAHAQGTVQLPLQFDFLNPGARSLSLGSAFVGLADDATAAFTNPAGLRQLLKPEFSVEFRYRRLTTPFLYRGRLAGTPTNIGEDTINGPEYGESVSSAITPSFLSVVIPTKVASFAFYRHEIVNLENELEYRGAFEADLFGSASRELPLTGSREVGIVSYGGSGSVSLGDRVSIGAGVALYDFDLEAHFARHDFTEAPVAYPFGAPDYSIVLATADQQGDDVGFGFNVGAQFTITPKIKAGAVYRKGPSFDFAINQVVNGVNIPESQGTFQVPDVFAIGATVRPTDQLLFTAEYTRVEYSSLLDDYVRLQTRALGRFEQLELKDGNEFHLGGEYVFSASRFVPAVRLGTWYDPDHAVRYQPTSANDRLDVRLSATLPGTDSVWHFTSGFGMSLSQRFELNAAMDLASRTKIGTGSVIVRF